VHAALNWPEACTLWIHVAVFSHEIQVKNSRMHGHLAGGLLIAEAKNGRFWVGKPANPPVENCANPDGDFWATFLWSRLTASEAGRGEDRYPQDTRGDRLLPSAAWTANDVGPPER